MTEPGSTVDPTPNVLSLVEASVKRLDDLRESDRRHAEHIERLNGELRRAETARIDAIRAVDVGAVSRAAEVSAAQATTLAAAVSASAEALRSQVALTATASATALAAALEPIQKSIDDLRKTQYEQAGQRQQVTERRQGNAAVYAAIGAGGTLFFVLLGLLAFVATRHA